MDPLLERLRDIAASIRIADLVDIGLVALLLYALLGWLRRGVPAPVARRAYALALLLGAVYLATRAFELYLVTRLLQALLLVVLVAVVVVFQDEFRRLLHRLGSWAPFQRTSAAAPATAPVADLVEAVEHLAEQRVGALIAIAGREPWEEHLSGGVELDGEVSPPLLYSVFDPATPGHDGAVLLEAGRVSRFGVHLPLPRSLPEASRYGGTRHAAALGLSERCDALVIAVSEERGSVSVAQGGQLEEVEGGSDLTDRIERFWQRERSDEARTGPPRALGTGLLSLSLAAFAWLLFAYSPNTSLRAFEVPLEIRNLPETWALGEIDPARVAVTVRGPERAFERIDADTLALPLALEAPEEGVNRLPIDEGSLPLPLELEITEIEPRTARVVARRLVAVEVPVEVPTVGVPPEGRELAELEVTPASVELLVAAQTARPRRVLTEPLDLRDAASGDRIERRLALREDQRLPSGAPNEVRVVVRLRDARSP